MAKTLPNLGASKFFSWVLPLLVVRQYSKLSSYAIIREAKNLIFGSYFGPFGPNLGPQFFLRVYLYYYLDIVPSYHRMQFKGKLIKQTWENGKKANFEPDFGPFWPNLGPKIFFVGFISTRCYILLKAIICNFKEN